MKEAIATVMHSLLPPLLIQDEKKVRPVCGLRSWAWVISVSTHTHTPHTQRYLQISTVQAKNPTRKKDAK